MCGVKTTKRPDEALGDVVLSGSLSPANQTGAEGDSGGKCRESVCAIPGRLILNSYQSDNTTECKRGENRRKRSTLLSGGEQKWRKVSNTYGSEYTSSPPLA